MIKLTDGAVRSWRASLKFLRVSVFLSPSSSSGPGRWTEDCRERNSGFFPLEPLPLANWCWEEARRNGHVMVELWEILVSSHWKDRGGLNTLEHWHGEVIWKRKKLFIKMFIYNLLWTIIHIWNIYVLRRTNTRIELSHCWDTTGIFLYREIWVFIAILASCGLAISDFNIWNLGFLTTFSFTVCQMCLRIIYNFENVTLPRPFLFTRLLGKC